MKRSSVHVARALYAAYSRHSSTPCKRAHGSASCVPHRGHGEEERRVRRLNKDRITIQDCIDMYSMKDKAVVLNDGRVVGFKKEK